MERITRVRARILLVIFLLVVGFFAFKLYDVQIIKTGGNTDNSSTFVSYTRVKAARGDILDRNGNVLVSNRASYDLVLNHYVLLSAKGTNDHLYRLVTSCLEQGIEYNDSFPVSKERPFTYTLSEQSSTKQGYFQKYLNYVGGLDSDITAPLLIENLRQRYKLPAEWTDEEARLVIGMRYEMALRGCVPSLSNFVFLTDASDEELSAVVELNVPGLAPEATTVREIHTPYAAHVLGYVGAMTPKQWEYYKTIDGYEMDAEVGQSGFEQEFEEYLHGVDGLRKDTVNTDGTLVSQEWVTKPQAGTNVEVSIDINLQMAAEDSLAKVMEKLRAQATGVDGYDAEGAAVVAMEVKTGQVLVSGSYPTYDLSKVFEQWNEILEADFNPLYNRALLATYPPGSTYKMSMVIAGIDSKVINSETTIYDASVYDEYEGFEAYCLYWTNYRMSHGSINASVALQKSCNYFFYWLGDHTRLSVMDATAKGLGLGELTGIELDESLGHRANAETKAALHTGEDKMWFQGDQILAAIGQSENKFTPIQLCVYASTLANQGTRYRATFLNRVVSDDYRTLVYQGSPEIMSTMEISDEAYMAYVEGMKMVAKSGGTAYTTFRNYPIEVAAKTGTAQHDQKNKSDNGAFICFAPADDPQIAIAVYGEKAGHGSDLAVVARDILDVYFDVDEIGDVITYENKLS